MTSTSCNWRRRTNRIIRTLHSNIVGGCRIGQNATIKKATEKNWWKSISKDIREFVGSCSKCQLANPYNKPSLVTLRPIPVHDNFHRWGIDLISPLKETKNRKKYIVVATEYLTRWAEVDSIAVKDAGSVHCFIHRVVFRFGACHILLHYQGHKFCNKVVKDLLLKLDMESAKTLAYHSQTNVLTES